jgi:hypothetical protein
MEFGCSICEYTSKQKKDVIRHINRKRSCGPGIKEIVEIPIDIKCEYCDKDFSSMQNLKYHQKHNCKQKDHILEEENKRLKEENRKLKEQKTETKNVTINNNGNTFNIFIVNNYDETKFDKLTDRTYNKIIRDSDEAYQIIPRLIKEVHFNPDMPENHNIFISNRTKNNKHLQIFRNGKWEIENKLSEIDNIISDKETNLSDWVAEKGEKYPEAMEKFNEYLGQKYDEDVSKLVKEEVERVLYNNKHMIKN